MRSGSGMHTVGVCGRTIKMYAIWPRTCHQSTKTFYYWSRIQNSWRTWSLTVESLSLWRISLLDRLDSTVCYEQRRNCRGHAGRIVPFFDVKTFTIRAFKETVSWLAMVNCHKRHVALKIIRQRNTDSVK